MIAMSEATCITAQSLYDHKGVGYEMFVVLCLKQVLWRSNF